MSNYQTNNPVPSIDPRDLDDNATVFDNLLNSAVSSVVDRTGVPRKTWYQMELDASALVSPNVSALASAVSAANKIFYFTGSGTGAVADFPAQARTFNAATTQDAQRAVLGIPWAGATTSTAATDANLITTTSILGVTGSTTNVPAAFSSGSMISTDVFSATSMMQLVKARTSDAISYRRMVSGTWQPWVPLVLGGVPLTTPLNNAAIQAIASAATVSINAATANTVSITGTTTITSLGTVATTGIRRRLIFAGALTLTNSASLIIPGGANITTAAGDVADVESTAANTWQVIDYQRANGEPVAMASTGTGSVVRATTPTLVTPIIGEARATVLQRSAPTTKTASFTLAATESWIVCNGAGSITVTLPNPGVAAAIGREVMFKNIAAQTVISSVTNVTPQAGGALSNVILPATVGKWVTLVSDGSTWQIMQSN